MTTVPLSQFQYKQKFLRLGIKNSKGCQKRIKIGTDEYVSKNFAIYLNPFNSIKTFRFERTNKGGLLLTQDPQGDIELEIAADVTLPASSTEPEGDYLYYERSYYSFQKKVIKEQGYVAIKFTRNIGGINYVE